MYEVSVSRNSYKNRRVLGYVARIDNDEFKTFFNRMLISFGQASGDEAKTFSHYHIVPVLGVMYNRHTKETFITDSPTRKPDGTPLGSRTGKVREYLDKVFAGWNPKP